MCHDFLLFLCYCIIFLHTYPYKHVHTLCCFCFVFFKLPHSFDVSQISLLLFGMKVGLQMSPEAQFSYQGERSLVCFYSTFFSGIVLPALYIKRLLFSVFCLLWELRFKSLTNVFVCWTVETTRLSRSDGAHCHGSFFIVLWDLTISPHRSGVPRTQGADPHPS